MVFRSIILLLEVLLLYLVYVPVVAMPCIQFEQTTIDLGHLKPGQEVKAVFSFKNTGDEILEIKEVKPTCKSCIEIKTLASKLQPNESSSIEIVVRVPSFGTTLDRIVMVETNDPVDPSTALMITGKITQIAVLSPKNVDFGKIKTGTVQHKTLLITPVNPDGFSIESIEFKGPHASIAGFSKTDDGSGSYIADIVFNAGNTPGRVFEAMSIHTTSPEDPPIPFLIYGTIVEDDQIVDKK